MLDLMQLVSQSIESFSLQCENAAANANANAKQNQMKPQQDKKVTNELTNEQIGRDNCTTTIVNNNKMIDIFYAYNA